MKLLRLLLLGLFFSNALALRVESQISADGTTNTMVNSTDNGVSIDEGDRAGDSLFHSFEQFNLSNGSEALFNNDNDIANIFSRVTGGDISEINGLIRANSDANLFLINPAGIIFGEGAALDIGGSFMASTAESIVFNDDVEFSATEVESEPLLTVNMPIGLNYGNNSGEIAVDGSNLEVDNAESLALLGGDVSITGGQITAPGGNVELGGLSEAGQVSFEARENAIDFDSISFPETIARADVSLNNDTNVNVQAVGGGNIKIDARNIELLGGESNTSSLRAGMTSDSDSNETQAGDIILNATGIISIDNGRITNEVEEQVIGNGGNIDFTGRSLFLDNGAVFSTNSSGQGNTGSITINASDTFLYNGGNSEETVISASLLGTGNGGNIAIDAPKVSLSKGATMVAHSFGRGNAGSITINASDNILLEGSNTGVGSQLFPGAVGNGGQITIDTSRLSVLNGATVVAHTDALGNAGNITIDANKVLLDGVSSNGQSSGLGSAAFELSNGNGGTIAIDTNLLNVTNGATLLVSSFGEKNAGRVIIDAADAVTFDGIGTNDVSSSAFSTVEAESIGNGREIKITADSLSVRNGAVIGASTSGAGDGGNIDVNVNSLQVENGGQILTTSRNSGDAGNISINTTEGIAIAGSDVTFSERLARAGRPPVQNEGAASGIFANTDVNSTGSGGNIDITAQSLSLNEDALINATNQGVGEIDNAGGNITLQIAENLTLENNSTISAQALLEANGGNIDLDAEFIIAVPNQNNDIIASAAEGTGGNIDITTNAIFGLEERSSTPINNTNDLDASSELGLDGTIEINEFEVNPAEGLDELPTELINVAELVEQNLCQRQTGSEFVVTGRGGTATSPTQARSGEVSEVDLVKPVKPKDFVEDSEVGEVKRDESESEIVEAQGWMINQRGMVQLLARKTNLNNLLVQSKAQVCQQQ